MSEAERKNKIQEINDRIDQLEKDRFMNNMNDHWNAEDYKFDRKCCDEIKALKEELQRL